MSRKTMRLALASLSAALCIGIGAVVADRAEAQCIVGPESSSTTTTGSFLSNYKTCSYGNASARVWTDTFVSSGRWRHAAAQRACGASGSFNVKLWTNRINSATGVGEQKWTTNSPSTCSSVGANHQNVTGNWYIVVARCAISIGC